MAAVVHIDIASQSEHIPDDEDIHRWVCAALLSAQSAGSAKSTEQKQNPELCIRIMDEEEITRLNSTYRHKTSATNVLSFPAELPEELDLPLLGDIAICAPVLVREALEQDKSITAHWAHLVIHGTLHLLGFDHIIASEAQLMEDRERQILAQLGFPDPYREASDAPPGQAQSI
jgi:probable rRNA maturation factor